MGNTLLCIDRNIMFFEDVDDDSELSIWAAFFVIRKEGANSLLRDLLDKVNLMSTKDGDDLGTPYIYNFTRSIYTYIVIYYGENDVEGIADSLWGFCMHLVVKHGDRAAELFGPSGFLKRDKEAFIRLMDLSLEANCENFT
jgi:hypothetical protein